jgi:hypothetical protein
MYWYKQKKENLLFIAGFVWMFAGIMLEKTGIPIFIVESHKLYLVIGSVIIFSIFNFLIFNRLVYKHENRIRNFSKESVPFWLFFDIKSYIIVAIMMSAGFSLRFFNLVPHWFIAFFYSGIGLALFSSGIKFIYKYMIFSNEIKS